MHTGRHNIRTLLARTGHILGHKPAVNVIHYSSSGQSNAICSVCIVKQRDFEPADINNGRDQGISGDRIMINTGIRHPNTVKHVDRAVHATVPPVKNMIVGQQKKIKTGIRKRHRIFIGSTETRITGTWLTSKRRFKIDHGIIGRLYIWPDRIKTSGIIIRTVSPPCRIYLCLMLHGITGKHYSSLLSCGKQ